MKLIVTLTAALIFAQTETVPVEQTATDWLSQVRRDVYYISKPLWPAVENCYGYKNCAEVVFCPAFHRGTHDVESMLNFVLTETEFAVIDPTMAVVYHFPFAYDGSREAIKVTPPGVLAAEGRSLRDDEIEEMASLFDDGRLCTAFRAQEKRQRSNPERSA